MMERGEHWPAPPCPLVGHRLFSEPPPVSVQGKKLLAPYLGCMGDGEEIQGTCPRFLDCLLPSPHLSVSLCLLVGYLQGFGAVTGWHWISWEFVLGEQEAAAHGHLYLSSRSTVSYCVHFPNAC